MVLENLHTKGCLSAEQENPKTLHTALELLAHIVQFCLAA